jgi:hypothetical protein
MNGKEKWVHMAYRWAAYKDGIRDKKAGRPAKTEADMGRYLLSYMEGYNETKAWKIAKYSKLPQQFKVIHDRPE